MLTAERSGHSVPLCQRLCCSGRLARSRCRVSRCVPFSSSLKNIAVVGAVGSFLPAAIRIPRVLLPHSVELRLLLVA